MSWTQQLEKRFRRSCPELDVEDQVDSVTARLPARVFVVTAGVDEETDLLVARTRNADRLRQRPDAPVGLCDRAPFVVEVRERGDEPNVDPGRLSGHAPSLRREAARHCGESVPKRAK